MEQIKFECRSVTPMFMYGADGSTPELRPASIKGVLRFWWRAIHGNLSLDELRNKEGEIFGSTEGRSKVVIQPIRITKEENYEISPTPHHKAGYCSSTQKNCYSFDASKKVCKKANKKLAKLYTFEIKMQIQNNPHLNKEQLENLFILASTLGGFGQRSRRGFGSIQAKCDRPTATKIESLIKTINEKFSYTHSNKKRDEKYPYIQDIEIGKNYANFEDMLETIGQASHANVCDELGYANKEGRLASPIYVSVLNFAKNDYRPIITTLYNTQSTGNGQVSGFKEAIL